MTMKNHNMRFLMWAFADWQSYTNMTGKGGNKRTQLRQQEAHFVCCHLEDLGFNPVDIVPPALWNDAEAFTKEYGAAK